MADEAPQNNEIDETGQEQTPQNPDETPQAGAEGDEGGRSEGEGTPKLEELPEWARTEITSLRREAASRRTQLRDAEDKLSKAKTVEEFEEARTEYQSRVAALELENLKFEVGISAGLKPAAIKRLSGTTKEELEADAQELAELFGGNPSQPPAARGPRKDPRGGLDPSDEPETYDPRAVRAEMRQARAL